MYALHVKKIGDIYAQPDSSSFQDISLIITDVQKLTTKTEIVDSP
jgi:hypothetical protein